MPEPRTTRLRPIAMTRMTWVAVLVAVTVTACGSEASPSKEQVDPDTARRATVGACASGASQVQAARAIAAVDLDGDGTPDQVRLTAPGGECGNTLFAEIADGYVSTPLGAGVPPVTSGYAVAPDGTGGQLLITRADHPRGGFQLRVYTATPDRLTELKSRGETLFPFVATDVDEHPASIDCTDGGVVVTEAVPHEPVGVVAAWDVERTTYSVDGGKVTAGPTEEVADNVLPNQLTAQYPELVRHAAFPSCRVKG